jgi:long-subunit acyl-CoA synthetase (AMP-forming)
MQVEERISSAAIDELVAGKTVCTFFTETAERHPDADALRWQSEGKWQSLSWRAYRDRVRDLTLGLRSLGFEKGHFALILARNVPEHLIADLAIVHGGGAAVSVYNTLAAEQVEYLANHSEASVAFAEDDRFLAKLLSIRDRLPHLKHVVLVHGTPPAGDGWVMGWEKLMALGAGIASRDPNAFDASWRRVHPEDLAALIYTSGTTGPPKGVMYSHRNVVWTTVSGWRHLDVVEPLRQVSYLPLAHIAERFASHWGSVYRGDLIYLCPDQALLLPALLEARPTFFLGVPRVWEKFQSAIMSGIGADTDLARKEAILAAIAAARSLSAIRRGGAQAPPELVAGVERARPVLAALRAKLGLDQCRLAITSTAPLALDVQEFFDAIGLPLVEVWGMSEVTGPGTAVPPHAPRMGTVGTALPGVEVKLGADGELLTRGGNLMVGYYKAPDQTAEAIDHDGWLHSGDIATVDADGYYRIVDRKKELIITAGGKNVSPANLESLIKHHPLIGQAVALGDGRKFISALIVLAPDVATGWARSHGIEATSMAALAKHPDVVAAVAKAIADANSKVSKAEQVKRFMILGAEWTAESEELTPTLKLKRRVVDSKYAGEINAIYGDPPGGYDVEETLKP